MLSYVLISLFAIALDSRTASMSVVTAQCPMEAYSFCHCSPISHSIKCNEMLTEFPPSDYNDVDYVTLEVKSCDCHFSPFNISTAIAIKRVFFDVSCKDRCLNGVREPGVTYEFINVNNCSWSTTTASSTAVTTPSTVPSTTVLSTTLSSTLPSTSIPVSVLTSASSVETSTSTSSVDSSSPMSSAETTSSETTTSFTSLSSAASEETSAQTSSESSAPSTSTETPPDDDKKTLIIILSAVLVVLAVLLVIVVSVTVFCGVRDRRSGTYERSKIEMSRFDGSLAQY